MNPGGGGCGEPRSRHCTPAWVARAKLRLKKKKKERKRVVEGIVSLRFWDDSRARVYMATAWCFQHNLCNSAERTMISLRVHCVSWPFHTGIVPSPSSSAHCLPSALSICCSLSSAPYGEGWFCLPEGPALSFLCPFLEPSL